MPASSASGYFLPGTAALYYPSNATTTLVKAASALVRASKMLFLLVGYGMR